MHRADDLTYRLQIVESCVADTNRSAQITDSADLRCLSGGHGVCAGLVAQQPGRERREYAASADSHQRHSLSRDFGKFPGNSHELWKFLGNLPKSPGISDPQK